jgi:hypothetical protein
MRNVKLLIDFFFQFLLLFLNLYVFVNNLKKIINHRVILIFRDGGFGHQFVFADLSRHFYKDTAKVLVIFFYDQKRYNRYLYDFLGINYILFKSAISVHLLGKIYTFGDYERVTSGFRYLTNFIIFLINFLCIKSKIFERQGFYKKVETIYRNSKIRRTDYPISHLGIRHPSYVDMYFYFVNRKRKKKFFYKNLELSKINYFSLAHSVKSAKVCIFYLRYKNPNHPVDNLRNGAGNLNYYKSSINYLLNKNYKIYFFGNLNPYKKQIKKIVNCFTSNDFNVSEDFFQCYVSSFAHLFISECGGAQYFGLYSKISILINCLPIGHSPPFDLIVNKKIKKPNGSYFSEKEAERLYKYSFNFDNNKPELVSSFDLNRKIRKIII